MHRCDHFVRKRSWKCDHRRIRGRGNDHCQLQRGEWNGHANCTDRVAYQPVPASKGGHIGRGNVSSSGFSNWPVRDRVHRCLQRDECFSDMDVEQYQCRYLPYPIQWSTLLCGGWIRNHHGHKQFGDWQSRDRSPVVPSNTDDQNKSIRSSTFVLYCLSN